MAMSRTWFNTLVDDNGTNQTGTVWNKSQIDSFMTTIDAELQTGGNWTPQLFTNQGLGQPGYSSVTGSWIRDQNLIWIAGRIAMVSDGALYKPGELVIGNLPFATHASILGQGLVVSYVNGLSVAASMILITLNSNDTKGEIRKLAAGGGTGTVSLLSTEILPSFDLRFNGVYRIP